MADDKPETFAREALRQALVNLDAIDAPAGTMPVVLGPGWPGVLLHEAVGHGLEGDFNRKGTVGLCRPHGPAGRGEGRAPSSMTARSTARRGSLNIDDEGTPTQLHHADRGRHPQAATCRTRMNARLMGMRADRQRPPRIASRTCRCRA